MKVIKVLLILLVEGKEAITAIVVEAEGVVLLVVMAIKVRLSPCALMFHLTSTTGAIIIQLIL